MLKRIFGNKDRVIFDDYLESPRLKKDFKEFDKMIERRIEKNSIYKTSILKNINKIIFLISFACWGIVLSYSIMQPIAMSMSYIFNIELEKIIIENIIINAIIICAFIYKYVTYISKSTSERENLNLYITYIALIIMIGIFILTGNIKNVINTFKEEVGLYKIIVNQILAIIVVLYMFNIIKHDEKREYWYYIFIVISIFSIVMNLKITSCIDIIFFTTYLFYKSPKHIRLKENDYVWKWKAFKNFLEDYSMLNEQEESAILIWEEYLIYAISLGINKKVVKKYSKLSKNYLIDDKFIKNLYIEYFE